MEFINKLMLATLAVLTISSIACTRVIPVKLELPKKPIYNDGITNGIIAVYNRTDQIMYYKVSIGSIKKLAKNKALCREDNKTLRAIIKTTY